MNGRVFMIERLECMIDVLTTQALWRVVKPNTISITLNRRADPLLLLFKAAPNERISGEVGQQ